MDEKLWVSKDRVERECQSVAVTTTAIIKYLAYLGEDICQLARDEAINPEEVS